MKIRNGFISNSSSSSFIITNQKYFDKVKEILEDCKEDYYIFKNVLYTSFISEDKIYSNLESLATDEIEGNIGGPPYGDEEDWIEVEGEIGRESVWLPRQNLTDEDLIKLGKAPYYISSKMYFEVEKFMKIVNPTINDRDNLIQTLKNIYEYDFE